MTAGVRGYSTSEGERKGDFTRLLTASYIGGRERCIGLAYRYGQKWGHKMDDSQRLVLLSRSLV